MVVFSLLHVNILNIYVLTPFLEPPYHKLLNGTHGELDEPVIGT